MQRQWTTILVLAAMLPQLLLGVGSGRLFELCLCQETHVVAGDGHACCDHSESGDSNSPSDNDPRLTDQVTSNTDADCPGIHLTIGGHYGRFEPVRTWDVCAVLSALLMCPVEGATDESPVFRSAVRAVPRGGTDSVLRVVQTTRLLI